MKAKTLQDKLARSLDAANTREAKVRPRPQAPQLAQDAPAQAAPAKGGGCEKLSVSLFAADRAKVEGIRAYVHTERGAFISTSAALRLALRAAPLSRALLDALDASAAEDGRKGSKVSK